MNKMQLIENTIRTTQIDKIDSISTKRLVQVMVNQGLDIVYGDAFRFCKQYPKVDRGTYDLSSIVQGVDMSTVIEQPAPVVQNIVPMKKPVERVDVTGGVQTVTSVASHVPSKCDEFVAWGNFKDITTVVKAKGFFPAYIQGLSGNGKTMMVEQACARTGREYLRAQITPETDEDDLIGGFRLINGETVFVDGPVTVAMKTGALLTIDELDRGTNKIMCLQGIMEGKPFLVKKTGELVHPHPNFNVIATANTKGRGSDDGRYTAAGIIDDAFLERFPITIEQGYPSSTVEKKIVMKHMEKFGNVDEDFANHLCSWSDTIRKTFDDDGIDELISTRRLCHIVETHARFNDKLKSITLCINRFDADVREAFLDLYEKVDVSVIVDDSEVDRDEAIDEILNGM